MILLILFIGIENFKCINNIISFYRFGKLRIDILRSLTITHKEIIDSLVWGLYNAIIIVHRKN